MRRIYPFSLPKSPTVAAPPLLSSTTMPPKRIADDSALKARKLRAPKERPPGITNAAWAADMERRQTETRGRAEREKKLAAKRAAAADEQARLVSMAMGQPRIGQFPAGSWPIQGMIGSPSTYSLAASSPMFQETYVPAMLRFTPSPPEYDAAMHEGISPALRRGPLSYGMPPLNDGVMHDMITSGSMAAAANLGFFTQEEARATEAVAAASRGGVDGIGDAMQDINEEEKEQAQVDEEDDAPEPSSTAKGRKKRKKTLPPTEPQVKWMGKEEECLTEAWKTVSMNGVTGANQNFDTYLQWVKTAFDEHKLVDPYFNKTVMVRGEKAMATHWRIMQAACNKWHDIQEEIADRPISGANFETKVCLLTFSVDIGSPSCDDAGFSVQMRRAFDMYGDDSDDEQFKYINVFARIDDCEKWAEVCQTLSKNKDEQYNPDTPTAAALAGRSEFGQKKLKELKKSGAPADRLQASLEKSRADARMHNAKRDTKYDVCWKEMLAN
jgi:hypothetical protein